MGIETVSQNIGKIINFRTPAVTSHGYWNEGDSSPFTTMAFSTLAPYLLDGVQFTGGHVHPFIDFNVGAIFGIDLGIPKTVTSILIHGHSAEGNVPWWDGDASTDTLLVLHSNTNGSWTLAQSFFRPPFILATETTFTLQLTLTTPVVAQWLKIVAQNVIRTPQRAYYTFGIDVCEIEVIAASSGGDLESVSQPIGGTRMRRNADNVPGEVVAGDIAWVSQPCGDIIRLRRNLSNVPEE